MPSLSHQCLPPPEHYTRAAFAMPEGACDSHSHVTPCGGWKLAPDASYTPAAAPPSESRRMRAAIGFQRGVVVQASAFGTDNSGVYEALADEPDTLRGVVVVVAAAISDADIERLHRLGVRGVRAITAGLGGSVGVGELVSLAPRIASYGWHVEILAQANQWEELLPTLLKLNCKLVIDHMGGIPANLGIDHFAAKAVRTLLLERDGWLKLNGYRLTDDLHDPRLIERAHRYYQEAPEKLVWGTDWPHVGLAPMADAGVLLNAFARWFDNDSSVLKKILATNPEKLFDFPKPAGRS